MKKKVKIKLNQQALAAMRVTESTPEANTQWLGGLTNTQQDNNHTASHFNWQPFFYFAVGAALFGIGIAVGRYSKESKMQANANYNDHKIAPFEVYWDLNNNQVHLNLQKTFVFDPKNSTYRKVIGNFANAFEYDLTDFAKNDKVKQAVFEDIKANGEVAFNQLSKKQGELVYNHVIKMFEDNVPAYNTYAVDYVDLYMRTKANLPIDLRNYGRAYGDPEIKRGGEEAFEFLNKLSGYEIKFDPEKLSTRSHSNGGE